jgi:hypothetical protein
VTSRLTSGLDGTHERDVGGHQVWWVVWPGERPDQFGRTSTYLEPHAEQRNLPFTSGNVVAGP